MDHRPNTGRTWLRAAAAILAVEACLTVLYAPFLAAPVLPDVGVQLPVIGWVAAVWAVLALATLLAAAGVAARLDWGRWLAVALSVPAAAAALVGALGALLRLDPVAMATSLVGLGLDVAVAFAVLRRWPGPPRTARPQASARPARRQPHAHR